MEEVNDPLKLQRIQQMVLSEMPLISPHIQYRVVKVREESSNYEGHEWYFVDISCNNQMAFYGMLDAGMSRLYLTSRGMMVLVQWMIEYELDAFNAGHHWRYKGL